MQEKLDKLSAFCSDWCLDINIKKTKVWFLTRQDLKRAFKAF
jgi:hypothetical protein